MIHQVSPIRRNWRPTRNSARLRSLLYLDATPWILLGLALSWVVARVVFAPGRITYHRIMGAILLYLTIGVTFVAHYTFVGLLVPNSFSGMALKDSPTFASTMIYFSFGTLTTAGSADISRCTR